MTDSRPIGVFDSGVGGLTVLRALKAALPTESTVYLGDTARVPYGTRSAQTVITYAVNNARTLVKHGDIKALVVACNTVSAVAIEALRDAVSMPVIGVIEPGAEAALQALSVLRSVHPSSMPSSPSITVLGTQGTVRSGAYARVFAARGHTQLTTAIACPLLVPLAEEGWTTGDVPALVIHGADDPLLSHVHGQDIAESIPGAWYLKVGGMGHDLPAELFDLFEKALSANCARAG